jgi:pyruvate formate lyase activating enzyme
MKILGFQKESYQDWDEGLSSVIYTGNCNFKCLNCHAKKLLEGSNIYDQKEVLMYLESKKKHIKRLVISGGEPTLEGDLIAFVSDVKKIGLNVKLDTNGSNPQVLQELLNYNLLDYVAMDVKAPENLYGKIIGRDMDMNKIQESISLVSKFPDYEFRATIVPIINQNKTRWMNKNEVGETAKLIFDCSGEKNSKYFLQKFVARDKGEILDDNFSKEYLSKEMQETPNIHLEKCLVETKKILPNTKIR